MWRFLYFWGIGVFILVGFGLRRGRICFYRRSFFFLLIINLKIGLIVLVLDLRKLVGEGEENSLGTFFCIWKIYIRVEGRGGEKGRCVEEVF